MNNTQHLKNAARALAITLSVLIAVNAYSLCHAKAEKPNILFILADDLGYSDLGFMGSLYYETPHIDALANNGIIFTDGYSGSQVCSPARASIMTGQFTARHGITDWIGAATGVNWQKKKKRHSKLLPAEYQWHIAKEVITFPEALQSAGYTTFFAGKWHLGGKGNFPEDHGFDINKGGIDRGSPPGGFYAPFNNPKLKNRERGENLSMRLAKETADFITSTKSEPFLAYLSFYAVHAPLQTTKEKWMKYRDKAESMGIADQGFAKGDLLPMRLHQDNPVYAGLIESMDDAVGHVLNTLKESGLDKNTIVIFTSDNGGVVSGDHYSTSCLALKGGKGHQWEGGIRIPFVVSVPWLNHNGQRNKTPVAGSDFYPTLLELAGVPIPAEADIDGKSLVPVLEGKTLDERPLYWHYPHYGNQGGRPVSIMRQGDWKIIHYWEDGRNELYNLAQDIHEESDLSQQEPERTQTMSKTLFKWLDDTGAKLPTPDPSHNEAKEQQVIARMQSNAIKKQEAIRREMLNKDWQPNKTWWGSISTED